MRIVRNWTARTIAAGRCGIATGGGYLIPCPCPGHGKGRGDLHPSLFIRDGDRRLLVRCYAGCEPAAIMEALGRMPRIPPAPFRRPANTSADLARAIWRQAQPLAATPAEAYLVARGLAAAQLPAATLRFLPPRPRHPHPTLVAALTDLDNRLVAVELTYLDPSAPRKAELAAPRRMLGTALGAAIHCGPAAATICLAEGLESALSALSLFAVPVWAAASAERLPAVALPPIVRSVLYFGDADRAGARALEKLRAARANLEILIAPAHNLIATGMTYCRLATSSTGTSDVRSSASRGAIADVAGGRMRIGAGSVAVAILIA
ncbi:DUF7146 domain-containing protein [Bradyrhizobium sp. USDA 3256]